MKSTYTSDQLFHFVGLRSPSNDEANYQMLLTVLQSGRISHPPHADNQGTISYTYNLAGSLTKEDLIRGTVICFCDIPKEHLGIHLRKYGKFGVSFTRKFLLEHGARPVTYVPYSNSNGMSINGGNMLEHWEAIFRGVHEHLSDDAGRVSRGFKSQPKSPAEAISAIRSVFEKDFLAFIKPFNADLEDADDANYYLEREWRKYGNLSATPETLNAVWVPEEYIKRFQQDMPRFAMHVKAI